MNFYAFEYEQDIDLESISSEDTEYVQIIKNENYYFLHKKIYGNDFPDDWSDEQSRETKIGVVTGLGQLKEQIFILIDLKEKHIFSSVDSAKRTNRIIDELLTVKFNIFQRLVDINEFESKITKLTGVTIKPQSLKQKNIFANDILNFGNRIIDLSEVEDFKLDITYNLGTKKNKIVSMYNQLVNEYNVGDVIFRGSDKDDLFQFNKNSLIQKIPVKLLKNGEGNIFDYKEVYQLLIKQL